MTEKDWKIFEWAFQYVAVIDLERRNRWLASQLDRYNERFKIRYPDGSSTIPEPGHSDFEIWEDNILWKGGAMMNCL